MNDPDLSITPSFLLIIIVWISSLFPTFYLVLFPSRWIATFFSSFQITNFWTLQKNLLIFPSFLSIFLKLFAPFLFYFFLPSHLSESLFQPHKARNCYFISFFWYISTLVQSWSMCEKTQSNLEILTALKATKNDKICNQNDFAKKKSTQQKPRQEKSLCRGSERRGRSEKKAMKQNK